MMREPFTYSDLRKCAEREVALRKGVYAKIGWTDARRRELELMQEIARVFETWARFYGEPEGPPLLLDDGNDVVGRADKPLVPNQHADLDPVLGEVMGDDDHAEMSDRNPDGVQNLPQHATPPLAEGKAALFADGANAVNAKVSPYHDPSWPLRKCDRCGGNYRGPAVYCSFVCAVADA